MAHQVLNSAGQIKGPTAGQEITYDQITSSVTDTTTTEGTATTLITSTAATFDGAPVMLEVFFPEVTNNQGPKHITLLLFESSTCLGQIGSWLTSAANTPQFAASVQVRMQPTAGEHTYIIKGMSPDGGTSSFNCGAAGAGNQTPAFARITKV